MTTLAGVRSPRTSCGLVGLRTGCGEAWKLRAAVDGAGHRWSPEAGETGWGTEDAGLSFPGPVAFLKQHEILRVEAVTKRARWGASEIPSGVPIGRAAGDTARRCRGSSRGEDEPGLGKAECERPRGVQTGWTRRAGAPMELHKQTEDVLCGRQPHISVLSSPCVSSASD